jgi:dTDP-4-amino-4,6-dideoxygalactose transaminase
MIEVPFHRPYITEDEIGEVVDSLRTGWLTIGPKTARFETDFAAFLGSPHAVALNSCTAALHLALVTLGVGEGDEVIVPDMTFTATGEVAVWLGARPVVVDVDPVTRNMTPEAFERAITPRTKAVIPVHHGGQPCDMDEILETARLRGVAVVEDCAHAVPASYRGRPAGTLGDVGCFSFYATKTLATGEGGMFVTGREALAERARLLRLHGISRDAWKRYTKEGSWRYDVLEAGYKCNMTDLQAGLGLAQLRKVVAMREMRASVARRYDAAFSGLTGLITPVIRPDRETAWHLYVVEIGEGALTVGRDRVIELLNERGIGTSVHFIPLHRHTWWREKAGLKAADYPASEGMFERMLSLPIWPGMKEADVDAVIGALVDIFRRYMK